jgi:hypothetical protein
MPERRDLPLESMNFFAPLSTALGSASAVKVGGSTLTWIHYPRTLVMHGTCSNGNICDVATIGVVR